MTDLTETEENELAAVLGAATEAGELMAFGQRVRFAGLVERGANAAGLVAVVVVLRTSKALFKASVQTKKL